MIRDTIEECEKLRSASPSSKAKMISYGILRKYKSGEVLFLEREAVDRIYFLISGYVALYKINRKMDKRVIYLLGPAEILNEVILEEEKASATCVALCDMEVLSFSKKQFLEIMENDFTFSQMVIKSMAKKIRRLYRQVSNAANAMHLERQVASKLWKLGKDFGVLEEDRVGIPFPMTISFLADMVGSKRETVSRIIKKMSENGYVCFQRNKCYILDMEKLRKIVDDEDGA